MPIEFKMKPSSAALMAALSAVYPLTGQAASAGRVDFAIGDVKALAPDGRSRPLAKGAEVENGETIDTGSGRAQVRFTDGAQVSLAPQSQFRIDDYKFAGKADGSEKGFFSLLRGAMRTITGLVGRSNRDNYKVSTTVATIGIRGTEYSVTYGNSISVTTGEGTIEVCNAAGCLILNSGETAYVPDNNTQPTMTDKKTEIPPPPAQDPIPQFVTGNSASGGFPVLPSGPGYSMAMMGQKDGAEGIFFFNGAGGASTVANFDGSGAMASYSYDGGAGATSFTTGNSVGAISDGIIGWGRWSSGSLDQVGSPYSLQNVHYVVGMPTPDADLTALGGMTGTYSLLGFTYPTAWDGSTTMVGTQPISGSLTADFGAMTVGGNLSVPLGSNTYTTSWAGWSINTPGAYFSGNPSWSGGSCCGCSSDIRGFFAGANASRAGLTYQVSGTDYGYISGAATFKQTGLAP